MTSTMLEYSSHPIHFVSEVEVFAGALIGRNGAQTKRQRETSMSMKDKNDRDIAYTVQCILQGQEQDVSKVEALERSIACLDVAVHEPRPIKRFGRLVSFTWVAAAISYASACRDRDVLVRPKSCRMTCNICASESMKHLVRSPMLGSRPAANT